MMLEFLSGINTNLVFFRVSYLYFLENLHCLKIKEFTITKVEYGRVLKFNAQTRTNGNSFQIDMTSMGHELLLHTTQTYYLGEVYLHLDQSKK